MSDLLIRGMEMPKDGFITVTITSDGMVVGNSKRERDKFEYLDNKDIATAVPVPAHGRLGDMDAIARKIRRFGDYVDFTKDEIAGWFENGDFETIIPAEQSGKEV